MYIDEKDIELIKELPISKLRRALSTNRIVETSPLAGSTTISRIDDKAKLMFLIYVLTKKRKETLDRYLKRDKSKVRRII